MTYYINIHTWDSLNATIIDEPTMTAAENGENYLNEAEFVWLCEANSMEEARDIWWKEVSESMADRMMEANHP